MLANTPVLFSTSGGGGSAFDDGAGDASISHQMLARDSSPLPIDCHIFGSRDGPSNGLVPSPGSSGNRCLSPAAAVLGKPADNLEVLNRLSSSTVLCFASGGPVRSEEGRLSACTLVSPTLPLRSTTLRRDPEFPASFCLSEASSAHASSIS